MSPQDHQKQAAAQAALQYVEENAIIGVGTGSTVNFFIQALLGAPIRIKAAVSSSVASAELLRKGGIEVMDLNDSGGLDVYIDGADEVTADLHMIKGGGAALTREKIIAAASRQFVCIADGSKLVKKLGKFPLPVEVIPMARSYVARELTQLGGVPEWRVRDGKPVITDNGNAVLDVYELDIADPVALESQINQIAGVVCNGLFARRGANIVLLAEPEGVRTIKSVPA